MKERTTLEFSQKTGKITYLFCVMLALFILVGTRDVLYGRDTLGYVLEFNKPRRLDLLNSVEPGYLLFINVMHNITKNYHIFLLVSYISTVFALYKLMEKFFSCSFEILASICIYTLLGLLAFNMAALRQTIALSFGIFAFIYTTDGNLLKYLFCVAIAFTFHNSAFVLLSLYPLKYFDFKNYGFILVGVCFAIGVIAPSLVVPFLQSHIPMEDRFSQYGTLYESSQNYTGFVLQLILVIVAYIQRNKIQLETKTKNLFFNVAYIGLAVQALTGSLAELYRLSFYFCVYDVILIPLALSTFVGSYSKLIRIFFIISCLIYVFLLSGDGVLTTKQDYIIPFYL